MEEAWKFWESEPNDAASSSSQNNTGTAISPPTTER